jgi:hypothetical protein
VRRTAEVEAREHPGKTYQGAGGNASPNRVASLALLLYDENKVVLFPGSSTVEHSAVNRRVPSSNLGRGAKFSISFCWLPMAHSRDLAFTSGFVTGFRTDQSFNELAHAMGDPKRLLDGSLIE